MASIYTSRSILKYVFVIFSVLITGVSIYVTQILVEKLAEEESERIQLWADATRELVRTDNLDSDLSFVQKVIESNHTIPVVLADDEGNVMSVRNFEQSYATVEEYAFTHEPIVVEFDDGSRQFIYYDDSLLLRQLSYFPLVQVAVVVLFLLLMFLAFYALQRAEQNRVWIGLSRETAHQLGTPISSLLAWNELLKMRYPADESLAEMQKDVDRLSVIADRFSKIGSKPELVPVDVQSIVEQMINYMSKRTSNKVQYHFERTDDDTRALLNVDLFGWVIENLCKNAIDAMEGIGEVRFTVSASAKQIFVDVSDTGKGIAKSKQRTIFLPGYTTKTRGWGLGLSLAKRIVAKYHKGKIFVLTSELGKGTTFRIVLRRVSK